jgi:hypothetical protein
VDLGDAQLSNVRRRGGVVEARIWYPFADRPGSATVAGTVVPLGPARIETVRIEDGG